MTTAQKIKALIAAGECETRAEAAFFLCDMGEITQAAADKIAGR